MMDWLYHELARDQRGEFDAHVDACTRCQGELAMFQRTREAVSALPELEPPSSITAILMHEAAKAAPAPARAAAIALEDDEPGGFLGWLSRLFSPIVLHPAATAVATLVLVAGVAGSIYIRGDHRVATHEVASAEPAPATPDTAEGMMRMPDEPAPSAGAAAAPGGEAGYQADLALEQNTWDKTGALEAQQKNQATQKRLSEIDGKLDEIERKLSRGDDTLRSNKRPRRGPPATANAVSGTDTLIDSGDEDGVLSNADDNFKQPVVAAKPKPKMPARDASRNAPAQDPAAPPPPPKKVATESENRYRVYKEEDKKEKAAEESKKDTGESLWAAGKKQELDKAAKLKKCQAAAKIANDILDRNPEFYYQKVNGSASIKTCSGFVAAERDRRAKSRGEKRAAKKAPRKGASAPAKAKAAPQPDEAAAESTD